MLMQWQVNSMSYEQSKSNQIKKVIAANGYN